MRWGGGGGSTRDTESTSFSSDLPVPLLRFMTSAAAEQRQAAITVKPRRGKEVRSPETLLFLFILLKERNRCERSSSDRSKAGKGYFPDSR